MDQDDHGEKPRKGIYLLPNLFTTAGLFAGFYAIVASIGGRFESAAIAIFVAMIMDGIDGRVARLTNTQSSFGVQYDSLSDLICFGLAPSLVMYTWALQDVVWSWAKLGWLAAFIYTACAALRLARFNVESDHVDKGFFHGLPSPPAAAVLAGMVWVGSDLGIDGSDLRIPGLLLTVVAGLLMVSNINYRSFKEIDFRNRVPFVVLLIVVLGFVFTSIDPPKVLFTCAVVYLFSGPVAAFWRWRRRRTGDAGGAA